MQRLIRTATSAFHKHGNEQAGVVAEFRAFLDKLDLHLDFHDLRGNREYVLFYNGAGLYALHECMLDFLKDVHGETNLLLKAVSADLGVPELVAGARALGLICKLVIAPLWRVLEDRRISILDMSSVYSAMHQKLTEWATDGSSLLDGSARPFPTAQVSVLDPVFSCLIQPASSDAVTLEILQVLCSTFSQYMGQLLIDHLPGGIFHQSTVDLAKETASVSNTNAIAERDFAQLDRFVREKPNASTIAMDGMIAFANNKTGAWLGAQTPAQRAKVLAIGRKTAPLLRDLYKDRQAEIRDHRIKQVEEKEKDIKKKREKVLQKKEALTQEISKCGGLWQTIDQAKVELAKLSSVSSQRAALRSQLFFRKFVLEQEAPSDVYALSKAGKVHSIECLVSNLATLLRSESDDTTASDDNAASDISAAAEPLAKRPLHSSSDT